MVKLLIVFKVICLKIKEILGALINVNLSVFFTVVV